MDIKAEDVLAEEIDIFSPKVLFEVVKKLNICVLNGLLIEKKGTCTLAQIKEEQPWPDDLINIEFETRNDP